MEATLNQILNINVESADKGDGGYSFINLDSKWDTLQRGGPWTPSDLTSLEQIHKDFSNNSRLTEILLR